MLRFLSFTSLFITLFLSNMEVRASCDLGQFLGKIVLPQKLDRSKWSKTIEQYLTDIDYKSGVNIPEKLFGLEISSIAQKNQESLKIIKDIESYQTRTIKFTENFKLIYGHSPSRDEYLQFYETRHHILKSGMDAFYSQVKKTTRSESSMWKQSVDGFISSQAKILESAKKENNLERMIDKLDEYSRRSLGSLTEFRTGVSLKGVQKVSFELKESSDISARIEAKLKYYENHLDELAKDYPKIEKSSMPVRGKSYTKEERLEEIRKWIGSKEIDVVRKVDGKTSWVEVKRNWAQFNDSNFSSAGMGKKSYRYQINETKEILHFLGLENEVQLEYLATGGMDDVLKSSLEADKIRVLNP
jgi:hypothetical protein